MKITIPIPMLIPIIGGFLLFFSCRSVKQPPEEFQKKQLIFGSGGGITGMVKQYALLENGYLYQKSSLDDLYTYHSKVSKKQCKHLFQQAEQLELPSRNFSHPGNRYFFMEYRDSTMNNRLTWGDINKNPSEDLSGFYTGLTELVSDNP